MAATRTILLPMPYTFEAAKITAQKVREVRDFLEVPVAVENVSSYAEFHVSEMTEWEFLNEVVERADCGILLDVNNIYVSSQNHNFDPMTYVNSVPAERVAQIHIAGHSKYRKYILDTHDHPVIDPVWKLYDRAIQRVGPHRHASGMGRQHSFVQGSPRRSAESQQVPGVQRARDRRMKLLKLATNHGARGDAAAHRVRAHAAQSARRPVHARLCRALHQAQRPPHFVRTAGNLQPAVLVPLAVQHDRRFSGSALGARRETLRRDVQGLPDRLPFAFVHAAQSGRETGIVATQASEVGRNQAAHWCWTSCGSNGRTSRRSTARRCPRCAPKISPALSGARLRLRLQPYVQLLSFHYPVDDLLLAVRKEDEDKDFASNAFEERRKRKHVRAVAKLKPGAIFLVVHRIDNSVYFRRIEAEEFAVLSRTAARERRSRKPSTPHSAKVQSRSDERAASVQQWFQNWATLGWFCRPEKKQASFLKLFRARDPHPI